MGTTGLLYKTNLVQFYLKYFEGLNNKIQIKFSYYFQEYNASSPTPIYQNDTQILTMSSNLFDYNTLLDEIFDRSEDDYRICGAQACPITVSFVNQSMGDNGFRILPLQTANFLIAVYSGACGAALLLGCLGLDKIKLLIYQVSVCLSL